MSARGARLLAALAGLLVGAVSLAVAFRGTSPSVVWGVLRAGHWVGAGSLVLASTAAFVYAKAMRWRLLLGAAPRAGLWLVLPPVLTGLALNAIVPHSGEFARAISLQRRAGRAAAAVLSSIVAERVFDLFGVLILGATALTTVAVNQRLEAAMRLIGAVAAVLALLIATLLVVPRPFERLLTILARPLPAAARKFALEQLRLALAGLEPIRSLSTSGIVLGWSLVQWLAVAAAVYACATVVGVSISAAACCLVVVGIVVAFLLPNAPGYAGSVQVAFLLVLRPLGVAEADALAASIVYQMLMVLPLIAAGLLCLNATLARAPLNAP